MKYSKLALLVATSLQISAFALTGCGGGGGGGGSDDHSSSSNSDTPITPVTPTTPSNSYDQISTYGYVYLDHFLDLASNTNSTINIDHATNVSAKIGTVTQVYTDGLASELENNYTWYYYIPIEKIKNHEITFPYKETFTITLDDGSVITDTMQLNVKDPLFQDQWHLYNFGQNPFDTEISPTKGIDLNVIPAWRNKITGSGAKVFVIDAKVDTKHEDLKNQIFTPTVMKNSSAVNEGLTLEDLTKSFYGRKVPHGTAVAGIIAAASANDHGVKGVAYNAKIASYELISHQSDAFYDALEENNVNVINASYTTPNSLSYDSVTTDQYYYDLLDQMTDNHVAYVKIEGNQFGNTDYLSEEILGKCLEYDVDCEFTQTSSLDRYVFNIQVGALNAEGKRAYYSSTGTNLWVSAFGGMLGSYATLNNLPTSPAIVTTYSSYDPAEFYDWDQYTPWRNENNKYYTAEMNGTSSAAPMVTGVAALAYSAKSDLTVHQLRYILATTARNDQALSTLAYDPIETIDYNNNAITTDLGWVRNSGGLRFSNQYGFGLVDAEAVAQKAQSCDQDAKCIIRQEAPKKFISTNENQCTYVGGSKNQIQCSMNNFKLEDSDEELNMDGLYELEGVSFNLYPLSYTIAQSSSICKDVNQPESSKSYYHPIAQKANAMLQIEMISPNNTKAIIKPYWSNYSYFNSDCRSDDSSCIFEDSYLDSNKELSISTSAFYTETINGATPFTLNFKSQCDLDLATFNKYMHMTVYGYKR